MANFLMPALGADMETGKVVQWLVAPGSRVKRGDVVAVVETHKGAIDVEIFLDGVIDGLVPLGTDLRIGEVLARVTSEGDAQGSAVPATANAKGPAVTAPGAVAAAAPDVVVRRMAESTAPTAAASPPVPSSPHAAAAHPAAALASTSRVAMSPAARRRAAELGVDAERLIGHGVDGAVTLADVEAAAHTPQAAAASTDAAPVRRGFDPAQMRQAIAAAMTRSKREIPHYYLSTTIDFAAASAWLEAYNRDLGPEDRLLPAVLLLAATARALAQVPQLNGFYLDGAFKPGAGVHLGWAVALRGGGLVAPAIHDADRKTPAQLMTALRDLVQRARTGGLRSSEMSDPTATVTSLGDRGAEGVLGVIYPPQVAMIGFGRVIERPWVVDGRIVPRPVINCSLAADHRSSDGHVGGLLLAAIDRALQSPPST